MTDQRKRSLCRYVETLAGRHPIDCGMVLRERNWRTPPGEIDLLPREGEVLVVCEVKTRTSDARGLSHEAVDAAKVGRLRLVADEWLAGHSAAPDEVPVDLIAVTRPPTVPPWWARLEDRPMPKARPAWRRRDPGPRPRTPIGLDRGEVLPNSGVWTTGSTRTLRAAVSDAEKWGWSVVNRAKPARRGVETGASAVEFALVMPILMLIVFGIIVYGMVFAQSLSLSNSARQAARSGVVDTAGGTCDQIINLAKDSADTMGMDGSDATVTVRADLTRPHLTRSWLCRWQQHQALHGLGRSAPPTST